MFVEKWGKTSRLTTQTTTRGGNMEERTVLVIDDWPNIRLISEVIQSFNFAPRLSIKGYFVAIKMSLSDILVLDNQLKKTDILILAKDLSTPTLIKTIRQKYPGTTIILTGTDFAEKGQEGEDFFLEKPFPIAQLGELIRQIIEKKEANPQ